jgi:hypothetical protein
MTTTATDPTWRIALAARLALPRCRAVSKQTGRQCGHHVSPPWQVCHWHGKRAGAPRDNVNRVTSAKFMREDRVVAKAHATLGRVVTAMLDNTTQVAKGTRPAGVGRLVHKNLVKMAATAEVMQEMAAEHKAERLEAAAAKRAKLGAVEPGPKLSKNQRARAARRAAADS